MQYRRQRYRLYPNETQRRVMARQFGCCRYLWNMFLRGRIDYYERTGKSAGFAKMSKALTRLKKKRPWLTEINAQALQQTLADLDKAYTAFFKKRAQFPRFKKRQSAQSFRIPQANRFSLEGIRLQLPKMKPIRIVLHRSLLGTPKSVTIIRESDGRYYASFCCEIKDPDPVFEGGTVGIDLGLKDFLVTSDGEKVENHQHLERSLKKLKRLQRQMSRKKKGSRNREQARQRLARQHAKVRHQRQDFLHR